jgi:hypothetical protein
MKISEVFEGENSSLRKAFDVATTPDTMRGKEKEIREAWGKFYESQTGNPPDEYDCVSYADWWLARLEAQRTADLEAIREGVEKMQYVQEEENGIFWRLGDKSTTEFTAKFHNAVIADTLSLIEQIMNKKI